MNIHLMVITDGRVECVDRTIESAEASLMGSITSRHIIDDSANNEYHHWLAKQFPRYQIHSFSQRAGYAGAIQRGWDAIPRGTDYVFHLEDDFVFLERINVDAMAVLLEVAGPTLHQLVLKRQPWNEQEKAAGGVVEQWPDLYEQIDTPLGSYTRHRLFFSADPCLYRACLTAGGWPQQPGSEQVFSQGLFADPDAHCAFLGAKTDRCKVLYIGGQRAGVGY